MDRKSSTERAVVQAAGNGKAVTEGSNLTVTATL